MTESTRTTLTREQLLGKAAKVRYEEVEIDGIGTVGIRQRTRLQESRRTFAMFDASGKFDNDKAVLQPFWRLIDQVMVDESTPMFSESDIATLGALPEGELDELFTAVQRFNSEVDDDPKKSVESEESGEN